MKFNAILALLSLVAVSGCDNKLPEFAPADEIVRLEQNWTPAQREQFYGTAQGSEIMPYAWFMALEQPGLNPFTEIPPFASQDFLSHFGFLPSTPSASNPDNLPIGLVQDATFIDPYSQQVRPALGLTCAACHTGQLNVRRADNTFVAVRIDGGSGSVDFQLFEQSLGQAIFLTQYNPLRFHRFAKKVLGNQYSAEGKSQLRAQLSRFYRAGAKELMLNSRLHIYPFPPGAGRVDGFNRVVNQLLGLGLNTNNLRVAEGPVNFPPIWETSWFDFVQYNGALPNPLLRNIGEALGAKAQVVLGGNKQDRYKSSVNLRNLVLLEDLIGGDAPYKGLNSPRWPEQEFGVIDQAKAAAGGALYAEYCAGCHLPPKALLQADLVADAPVYWTAENSLGQALLKLPMSDLEVIGTDSKQALNYVERQVDTGELGMGIVNAATATDAITQEIARRYFADNNISDEQQVEWGQGHPVGAEATRILKAYKARPLSGIWATPPYLHNGSVPSLYDLISPQSERPVIFPMGNFLFDPRKVGYTLDVAEGLTLLDTRLPGNNNTGHEFNQGSGPGIIGPKLTEEERWQLVEYLKTL